MSIAILNTAYFPNIQYFTKLLKFDKIVLECHDTYAKQTYRNRCEIMTANGVLPLSIPVIRKNHTIVKDVRIDFTENWQINHKRAIISAYKNSAYFEHYFPYFEEFFALKEKYLLDYNCKILNKFIDSFSFPINYVLSESFCSADINQIDYRDKIHPKQSKNAIDTHFKAFEYYQVFSHKFGFVPNLSIIDLLFNEGPLAQQNIKKSILE